MSTILGISAYYHDSAAALLVNGEIASAMQEERFTRIKHNSSVSIPRGPTHSCRLQLTLDDIDLIAYSKTII